LIQPHQRQNKLLIPPTPFTDLRAACFCHGQIVDQGQVCSICLSIYCAKSTCSLLKNGICPTCSSPSPG
jgi:transcription initiation factor TFIIH subunit 3